MVDSKLTESGIISSREYKTLENALSEVHGINKNFEQVNAKIDEVATKGTTVEVIEEVTKEEIERQIADGTIAHLMIEDGSVTPEKTSFYDEIATQKNLLKNAEFDYMGNNQNTVKKAIDSSIDWVLGEVNTAHHEGQHITATDTIEGHAKSAILKGNTVVNLCNAPNRSETLTSSSRFFHCELLRTLKANTTYTFIATITNSTTSNPIRFEYTHSDGTYLYPLLMDAGKNGLVKKHIVNEKDIDSLLLYISETDTGQVTISDVMIIEGDYTEVIDVPYFKGMQSVKMPVLTTTGKNLFDGAVSNGYLADSTGESVSQLGLHSTNYMKCSPNSIYTISGTLNNLAPRFYFYDSDKKYLGNDIGINNYKTYTAPSNACYMKFRLYAQEQCDITLFNAIQVEEGSAATPYEPYKSNILSTPSDLELRGIGEVQDTLNCLTGEVTERIGELVLDGSHNIVIGSDNIESYETMEFFIDYVYKDGMLNHKQISDKLPYDFSNDDYEHFYVSNKRVVVFVKKSKLATQDTNGFKQYLSQNPLTVQYQLATESIKTVDLSDNHVYSYKDVTHYDGSSAEGSLVPTLSIDVPTNLPAVVTRQRVTIQELEKENVALKNEIEETANSSVNGDLELMSSQFELDFRLFEIEMNLDMPMMAMMRGVKSMAMTVYQQAKTLILAGKYEREDMEYKLNRYKAAGRITVEEYEELIALMDARELVD